MRPLSVAMAREATMHKSELLHDIADIYREVRKSDDGQRCCVAPAPGLQDRIRQELATLKANAPALISDLVGLKTQKRVGFNDGLIVPGSELPLGTSPAVARSVAIDRSSALPTELNVLVVLVQFSDQKLTATKKHFEDLFFSTGVISTGSVREYFREVSNGKAMISGEVVGPFLMPRTMADYAHSVSGTGSSLPNARTLARDAALAADPKVNFKKYDNDGDGFVDAFVVVHAGRGAEETGRKTDIWSHKWVLENGALMADGSKVFAYLTVPEDAKLGVCAHELGHLLFGFPDLYDTDSSSEGVGNWCLMGGGSWLGGGNTPAHPSAWCKCQQNWVKTANLAVNSQRSIPDVKQSKEVLRLWNAGKASKEYFLVEHRRRSGFDKFLPGDGLLIWHIDDTIDSNTNELHPKVALLQADGAEDLEHARNRGDAADPYPGSGRKRQFNATSNPSSNSYGDLATNVALTDIQESGGIIKTMISVTGTRVTGRRKPPTSSGNRRSKPKTAKRKGRGRKAATGKGRKTGKTGASKPKRKTKKTTRKAGRVRAKSARRR
jgi:immune inhibitor A